jgi:hypothetical protein
MRRSVLFPLAVASGALVLGLAAGEATLRFLRPEATRAAILARIERERDSLLQPHAAFHHVGDGIFDLEFAVSDAGSSKRIMIIGDSFAMGHGVGREARFGTLLEKSLGGEFEVDVLAVSSYSPIIYRNIVRRAFSSASYAAVAVFVDQTDPADEVIYEKDLLDGGEAGRFNVASMTERNAFVNETYDRIVRGFAGWKGLLRRSAMINILDPPSLESSLPEESPHHRYLLLSSSRSMLIHAFNEAPNEKLTRTMETLMRRHLDEVVRLCLERGVPLILAANPWEHQVSMNPRVAGLYAGPFPRDNRLEQLLERAYGGVPGVAVLPLTQAFREHHDPSSLFMERPRNEIHWNEAGHVVVEQSLRAALQRKTFPRILK